MKTISYPFIRPQRAFPAFEDAVEYEGRQSRRRVLVMLGLLAWALIATVKLIDARHQLRAQDAFIGDCGKNLLLSGGAK